MTEVINSEEYVMHYSKDIENMICVAKGVSGKFEHGPAPIPEEGLWVKAKEIKDIKGLTHGIGWCAPQQGVSLHSTLKTA